MERLDRKLTPQSRTLSMLLPYSGWGEESNNVSPRSRLGPIVASKYRRGSVRSIVTGPIGLFDWTSGDEVMVDFSIRMNNELQFSSCEAPHKPMSKKQDEVLAVELRGNLVTITEVRKDGSFGSRIYAKRTLDLSGAATFMILPQLPSGIVDGSFFPAQGTVAILEANGGEKRRLRAVGTDTNGGRCQGWIFDAVEA